MNTLFCIELFPVRVVALHLLDKHGVHTLLVENWELQESGFCVKITWKLEEISPLVKNTQVCTKYADNTQGECPNKNWQFPGISSKKS